MQWSTEVLFYPRSKKAHLTQIAIDKKIKCYKRERSLKAVKVSWSQRGGFHFKRGTGSWMSCLSPLWHIFKQKVSSCVLEEWRFNCCLRTTTLFKTFKKKPFQNQISKRPLFSLYFKKGAKLLLFHFEVPQLRAKPFRCPQHQTKKFWAIWRSFWLFIAARRAWNSARCAQEKFNAGIPLLRGAPVRSGCADPTGDPATHFAQRLSF